MKKTASRDIHVYDQREHDLAPEIDQKGLILPNLAQKSTQITRTRGHHS